MGNKMVMKCNDLRNSVLLMKIFNFMYKSTYALIRDVLFTFLETLKTTIE